MPPELQALKEEYFRDRDGQTRVGMGLWKGGVFYSSGPRCTPKILASPWALRTDPPRLAEIQSWTDPLWETVAACGI